MNIDKVVNLKANYKITRLDISKVALIVCDWLQIPMMTDYIAKIALSLSSGDTKYEKAYLDAIKDPKIIARHKIVSFEWHNIVPLILRKELATLISWSTVTPSFKANIIALGTNAVAVNDADLQLGTEVKRAEFTNRYAVDNIAYLDKFFAPSEVQGNTYLEAGVFVDGVVATANSGYLLSHINMNETVSINETLTINATITVA